MYLKYDLDQIIDILLFFSRIDLEMHPSPTIRCIHYIKKKKISKYHVFHFLVHMTKIFREYICSPLFYS